MARGVINIDDPVGRVVGRRTQTQDSLVVQPDERADAVAWHRAVGGLGIAKGVYRFRSHEEADAWLWRMMTRPKV